MAKVTVTQLAAALEQIQAQMAELSKRLGALETEKATPQAVNGHAAAAQSGEALPVAAAPAGITEEELLAISAAIGAYLGVRAHIRQIRLVSSTAWAQEGRVSIQASHRLQG